MPGDVICSQCNQPVYYHSVKTFENPEYTHLATWLGTVCPKCKRVYCGDCVPAQLSGTLKMEGGRIVDIEGLPMPKCPNCKTTLLPAQRRYLKTAGLNV